MWWLPLVFLASALGEPSQVLFNREPPGPPLPAGARDTTYEERWFNARLNQFDASNTETFPMRYFYNAMGSRDVVIFVGGEWPISSQWVTSGLAHDLAALSSSSLFYTEHRYYGLTRPVNDTSVENLRFLTVDQALADLAQFITYIKSEDFEFGRYRNGKVVLVGCSYAGTMATWMRMQYPHLVDVALSDSGPLYAKEDFYQYLEVVGESFRAQGGQSCYDTIQTAIERVTQMLSEPTGSFQVSQIFNTCTSLSALNMDVASFQWFALIMPFAWTAQNAQPGSIAGACAALTNQTVSADPVQRLAEWLRPLNQPCVETRYTEIVNFNRDTSFDSPVAMGRAWLYQTCTEYGWYQSTSGTRHPFGSAVPVYYFVQLCQDIFSARQNHERLRYGISRTNLFFGGLRIPDHVVTVQGQFDPWHPAGPNATHSTPLTPVFFVPEISHCRIILPVAASENDEIRQVKIDVMNQINTWTNLGPASSAVRVLSSAIILAGVILAILV